MTLVRRLARPCSPPCSSPEGSTPCATPERKVPAADQVAPPIAAKLPYLPEDTEQLVRINGAVQVGAGLMLALGRFPRLSSALLAGSLVPDDAGRAPVLGGAGRDEAGPAADPLLQEPRRCSAG